MRLDPEISDLVVDYDPTTLARRAVRKDDVLAALRSHGNRWAARIVADWPTHDGVLDETFVDGVLVRSHLELQRLHEEFLMGFRVAEVLRPLLDALRGRGAPRPLRVVDLGCGMGFVVRWLALHGALGDDVELVGADYNVTFVRAAQHLATREGLRCRFVAGNAFELFHGGDGALGGPPTVFTSTGVLHHFRDDGLARVFEQQVAAGAHAFVHFDIKPSVLAPLGAWIFHQARMREPLARHDGYLSAARAHPDDALLAAIAKGAPGMRRAVFDGRVGLGRFTRIMHAVVGVRPELEEEFARALGTRTPRLSAMEGA